MDNEKEIPFGAFDSELMRQEIFIPKGFEATIEGDKIILKRTESEDERTRREIMEYITLYKDSLDDDEYRTWIAWLEKQGEQNSTDKVEPKFKVGDWVVCEVTGSVSQIKNCIENLSNHKCGYGLTNGGYICSDEVEHYHLWTIQDAKDGDVLANCNIICIYKNRESEHLIKVYLNYSLAEGVEVTDDTIGDFNLYPATKEQRDILFQKMKEAGYTFDFEKKELKKVEKKSQRMISAEAKEAMYDKPTDEDMKEALRTEYEKGRADAIAEMRKKWSEEDYAMIEAAINLAHEYGRHGLWVWLKSLKERYTWKPSDEQMNAFGQVYDWYNTYFAQSPSLNSLYNDLKKLKGE